MVLKGTSGTTPCSSDVRLPISGSITITRLDSRIETFHNRKGRIELIFRNQDSNKAIAMKLTLVSQWKAHYTVDDVLQIRKNKFCSSPKLWKWIQMKSGLGGYDLVKEYTLRPCLAKHYFGMNPFRNSSKRNIKFCHWSI
jgi:hypothetical protein